MFFRWGRCAGRLAVGLGALASASLQAAQDVAPPATISPAKAWLRAEVWGNPLWQYLAFLLYLIVAFYIARLLDYFIQAQLRRWTARTATGPNNLLLDLLHGPIRIIAFVILLHIGLRLFGWSDWTATFIFDGFNLLIAFSLTYLAIKLVDLLMGLWQQRAQSAQEGALDLHLFPIIRNTLKVFVIVVAVLVTSQNLGMNVTALLASLSIGGLAVGLAAQDTLSNLFGAVAIFGDKPFRTGDHIQVESIEGTVETIGLRSTRVRNLDGFLVTIPNKTMAAANIFNLSKRPGIRTVIDLGVTWDTPAHKVERAMALIHEIFGAHPKTADLLVSFNKFDGSAINIRVIHWWDSTSLTEYLLGFQELNLELKRRLDAEGLSFGCPSHIVHLRQDRAPRDGPQL